MSALVESPLQLLCAVEAHAAGHAGATTSVVARSDVPTLATATGAVRALGLPPGLEVTVGPARAALVPAPVRIVGDPFSGAFQSALVRGVPAERVVVVDDGLATLDAARRLLAGEPLVRLAAPVGPLRRTLAALATRRLRRLAAERRVTMVTMLPLDAVAASALRALGFDVVGHGFEWLRSRPADDGAGGSRFAEATVVVGSGLVADGLVHADRYAAWVRGLAADGPVRYLPHRRHDTQVTAGLAALPGVRVEVPGAPVELRLRGLPAGRRVVTLPSTSAVTLTRLLGPRGVEVVGHPVPDRWWTDRASARLRHHLGETADLTAAVAGSVDRREAA